MRLDPINKKRGQHTPTRSFVELAREFGVSCATLRGMMSKRADAPKPRITSHNNNYYDPVEFRLWMKARTA
jgi:hypothetical protein